jgi:myo-inositol-1(or 4)-monophosphatase
MLACARHASNSANHDTATSPKLRNSRHDTQRVRMLGASAIDLAWTAEGRLDACIILGNNPGDTSAGVLIAREAGARVLDHDGSDHSPQSMSTIAVTPTLAADLMAVVQTARAEIPDPE